MPLTDEMTIPDVAKVAARLSEAQRRAIVTAPRLDVGYWVALSLNTRAVTISSLKIRGIVNRLCFLTPLGLAVRDHIRGEAP